MHRHKKVTIIEKDGSYRQVCQKCGRELYHRPPVTNQRKVLSSDG